MITIETKTKIGEIDWRKVAIIGFWRQGAGCTEIACIFEHDFTVEEVEQIILNYINLKND